MTILTLKETQPRARKHHQCSLCTGPIHPGETYRRDTNVGDDHIYDWLECQPCTDDDIPGLVWEWSSAAYDEGIGPDTAHEWATDTAQYPGNPVAIIAATRYLERYDT